jgi:hypothetical protein
LCGGKAGKPGKIEKFEKKKKKKEKKENKSQDEDLSAICSEGRPEGHPLCLWFCARAPG